MNVTSELLLAGFCGVNGFDISFVPSSKSPSKKHDYDFIINGYPVQVKSLNTPEFVSEMALAKRQRKDKVESNKITYNYVLEMVLETIDNKISELNALYEHPWQDFIVVSRNI